MSSAGRTSPLAGARVARAAIYVLPAASVVVAALVFLGPGARRAAYGARVRGVASEGGRAVAVRVEVVKAVYDVIDGAGAHELLVEASAPGQSLRAWHGSTGEDGIAEVRLEAASPIRGPLALGVTELAPHARLLAAGGIALAPPPDVPVRRTQIAGNATGDFSVRVEAARGVLAAPFLETVRVFASPSGSAGAPAQRAEVELSGAGLDVAPPKSTTDDRGNAAFALRPLAHQIELTIAVRAGEKTGRWEGTLPVVPGAMWLAPSSDAGPRALLSPAPRERAYVSFWTETGRIAGAIVPLARDGRGFFAGELAVPEAPGARVLFATVAGDPLEQGAGTVAWPIRPAEGMPAAPALALLLDGLPAGEEREKQRSWTSRRTGLLLIGAAAIAEILLLLVQSRASQRRLEAHIAEASEALPEDDRERLMHAAREHPALHAVLAVALVGLGFALVAALATFR